MINLIRTSDNKGWSQLPHTKHKGKTLPQVVFIDPDYFFWGYEKEIFKGVLKAEAEEIYYKAKHIKIPQRDGEQRVVIYYIHRPTGKFESMELIPGSSVISDDYELILNVIDLSVPRQISSYDKCGSKEIILRTKAILFKNPSYKMTRARCEEFFNDANRFVL